MFISLARAVRSIIQLEHAENGTFISPSQTTTRKRYVVFS
jgi:hypothetical protein